MYWIDLDTLEIVAKEINCTEEEGVIYSQHTKEIINSHRNLLTIHSHPNSFPPSIADFNSNFENEYSVGIVVCHNGTIYMYKSDTSIREDYYHLIVADYQKQGYNINESQIKAIEKLKATFKIEFKEVTNNDV